MSDIEKTVRIQFTEKVQYDAIFTIGVDIGTDELELLENSIALSRSVNYGTNSIEYDAVKGLVTDDNITESYGVEDVEIIRN